VQFEINAPGACQWTEAQILDAIARTFPSCPHKHARRILKTVSVRRWNDIKLSAVVEQVAGNYARHELTDYDALIDRHGLDPDEARVVVADEIGDILRDWKQRPGSRRAR